jgi:hypothetical protein
MLAIRKRVVYGKNMKKRSGYTHTEAAETLRAWTNRKHLTQAAFVRLLEEKGILVSQGYLFQMMNGDRPPGEKFKSIFKEITGITLVDGLVEERKATAQREGQ